NTINPYESQVTKVSSWYNRANSVLLSVLQTRVKEAEVSSMWRLLVTYKNLMQSEEQFGISMVYGSAYYLRGVLDQPAYLAWAQATSMAWYWLNQSIIISPFIPRLLQSAGTPGDIAERLIER
ncbi:uncharacterized protein LOC122244998, partial [Penaeus japonicus]